mgnify:CR=1 FL=1
MLPGDIVRSIAGDVPLNDEIRESLLTELGLNKPLIAQYKDWISTFLEGNFGGKSLESKEPIRDMLFRQFPVTLLFTSYCIFVSVFISVPLGIYSAVSRRQRVNTLISVFSSAGMAIPNLCMGLLILLVLMNLFQWSPPIIYAEPWVDPWNHLKMVFVPVLLVGWELSSPLIRIVRYSVLQNFETTYILTAHAKGLSPNRILVTHSLPNALIPPITMLGLQIGLLISSVVIIETLFGLPGIGRGLIQACLARDFPVIQTLSCCLILFSLLISFSVDIISRLINPVMETYQDIE